MTALLAPPPGGDMAPPPVWRDSAARADHLAFIADVLRRADECRNPALAKLSAKDRKSMCHSSAQMVRASLPQFF
mgnify:CR=1 FL=1